MAFRDEYTAILLTSSKVESLRASKAVHEFPLISIEIPVLPQENAPSKRTIKGSGERLDGEETQGQKGGGYNKNVYYILMTFIVVSLSKSLIKRNSYWESEHKDDC